MNLITSATAFWFTLKPGGVSDKLCIFPADEKLTSWKQCCSGITGLSGPTMTAFVM